MNDGCLSERLDHLANVSRITSKLDWQIFQRHLSTWRDTRITPRMWGIIAARRVSGIGNTRCPRLRTRNNDLPSSYKLLSDVLALKFRDKSVRLVWHSLPELCNGAMFAETGFYSGVSEIVSRVEEYTVGERQIR